MKPTATIEAEWIEQLSTNRPANAGKELVPAGPVRVVRVRPPTWRQRRRAYRDGLAEEALRAGRRLPARWHPVTRVYRGTASRIDTALHQRDRRLVPIRQNAPRQRRAHRYGLFGEPVFRLVVLYAKPNRTPWERVVLGGKIAGGTMLATPFVYALYLIVRALIWIVANWQAVVGVLIAIAVLLIFAGGSAAKSRCCG